MNRPTRLPAAATRAVQVVWVRAAGTSTFDGGRHASQIEFASKFAAVERRPGGMLLGAAAASANIVYTVDRTITGGGKTGTVVGSITIDGVLGTLATSDIVAWTLTLNGAGASFTIANTDPTAFKDISGSDVTATPTDLFLNFRGPAGQLLLQDGAFQGTHYYCTETGSGPCLLGNLTFRYSFPTLRPSIPTPCRSGTRSSEPQSRSPRPGPSCWLASPCSHLAVIVRREGPSSRRQRREASNIETQKAAVGRPFFLGAVIHSALGDGGGNQRRER